MLEGDFSNILYDLENVSVGEMGEFLGDGADLYHILVDEIDFIGYMNELRSEKIEMVPLIQIALMSEIFQYWEENNIYTKNHRIKNGLTNVDKVIKKYHESLK